MGMNYLSLSWISEPSPVVGGSPSFDLEISFEAQLLWDHAMAKSVAMALEEDVFFFLGGG